jgi:hypothetical protein
LIASRTSTGIFDCESLLHTGGTTQDTEQHNDLEEGPYIHYNMTDIEGNPISYSRVPTSSPTTAQSTPIENPYADNPRTKRNVVDRILSYVKGTFYISLSTYVLHRFFRFYNAIFQSPYILHEWFKIGIALTVGTSVEANYSYGLHILNLSFPRFLPLLALLGVKAYVEVYEGRVKKATVDYKTFPQSTHAAIILFLLSSIAYHIALWPHYHYNTFIVLGIVFFGIVLQFIVMTPSSVQNVVSFVLLALFIQEYQ